MAIESRTDPRTERAVTRVVIADDHELARAGLKTMIDGERWIEVVGVATNGREAVELCRKLRPDLIMMDVRMPELDGLAATRLVKEVSPKTSVIVITMHENPNYLFEAIKAGAGGYLLKDASQMEVLSAIRQVLRGEALLSPKLMPHLIRRLAEGSRGHGDPSIQLTPREREVLRLVAHGKSNREIAEQLIVTEGTVKVHVGNIFSKLEVSDRTQAVVRAIDLGIIVPGGE